jgi:hypothetical protein
LIDPEGQRETEDNDTAIISIMSNIGARRPAMAAQWLDNHLFLIKLRVRIQPLSAPEAVFLVVCDPLINKL